MVKALPYKQHNRKPYQTFLVWALGLGAEKGLSLGQYRLSMRGHQSCALRRHGRNRRKE